MALSFRPRGVHVALIVSITASIVCGIGWFRTARESRILAQRQQALAAEFAETNETLSASRRDADRIQAEMETKLRELDSRIAGLAETRSEPPEAAGPFAVPHGEIRWVDHVGQRVWISLGEADGLKPRTTFSVYSKENSRENDGKHEVSIGESERKGSLEVTRVLEAHLSEARIINEDLKKRIAKGDPFHSPIWHLRMGEAISTIGMIDLDGDGAGDLDMFRRIVDLAGVRIDNEVDESGVLRVNGNIPADGKPQIDGQTKFIVIGRIPELKEQDDPAAADRVRKILQLRRELERGAREQGVRVISLKDFLSYIGFKPQSPKGAKTPKGASTSKVFRSLRRTLGRRRKIPQRLGVAHRNGDGHLLSTYLYNPCVSM
jgi:hypothetical protein